MGKNGLRAVRIGFVFAESVAAVVVGWAVDTYADNECIVQFGEPAGGGKNLLADGAQRCAVASGKTCTFQLGVCVNTVESGCTPATLKKTVKAKGKGCKATKVKVKPSGTNSSACGSFVGVTVKTKKKGKVEKTCTVTAKAKAKGGSASDSDTITLACMPSTATCPTTTTTTVVGATTTSTTLAPPTSSLSFTTAPGTTSCGSAGLAAPPAAPASGELDSDTAGTTKITDLGLGCLYFGGGSATVVPPGGIPDGAASFLAITGPGTLGASPGTGFNTCTQGVGATKHCINNNSTPTCSNDNDCGGSAGSCGADAKCAFGPPLPVLSPAPFGALTTCVLNVVQSDAGGTFDATTGASSVALPLSSRVYITGNTTSPCPKCVSGACTYGKTPAGACTAVGTLMTSNACLPSLGGFQAPLGVDLTPLTSGTSSKTSATGVFCPPSPPDVMNPTIGQVNAGAFGQSTAQRIAEVGMPAGNLSDMMPHNSILGSVFCIPGTGNPAVDGVADLPGPGAIGLNGMAQLH